MSRRKAITQAEGLGVDGWYMDMYTEKNKLAPGQHAVTCVFDKNNGIDKFWSEYTFLSELTPSENKISKKNKSFKFFPLMIKKSGSWVYLHVKDPANSDVNYKSDKFYRKDARNKYNTDNEFKQWFDYAVRMSAHFRIVEGIFKHSLKEETPLNVAEKDETEILVEQTLEIQGAVPEDTNEESTNNEIVKTVIEEKEEEYVPKEGEEGYQSVFD